MKDILKHPLVVTLAIGLLIIAGIISIVVLYTKEETLSGRVIEHNTASDRAGNIDYYTVASFEDGSIRSIRGLKFYVKPIGSEVEYTIRVWK